jgi:hypothetical protein
LDQEFAGVRRWLLSGGVGGLDGMVAALKARVFFPALYLASIQALLLADP